MYVFVYLFSICILSRRGTRQRRAWPRRCAVLLTTITLFIIINIDNINNNVVNIANIANIAQLRHPRKNIINMNHIISCYCTVKTI